MYKVFTLSYNLSTEVERATGLLKKLNPSCHHTIVDVGFPIIHGETIGHIPSNKSYNTKELKRIAGYYKSDYVKIENQGVSQNWMSVAKELNVQDDDVLICCDPDEVPLNEGWVDAIGDTVTSGYGVASLVMKAHMDILRQNNTTRKEINGRRVWEVQGVINWILIGVSGKLINDIGIPHPVKMGIYGGIEWAMLDSMRGKYSWAVLPDYLCDHTDNTFLYRKWKDDILHIPPQIPFEEWLKSDAAKNYVRQKLHV